MNACLRLQKDCRVVNITLCKRICREKISVRAFASALIFLYLSDDRNRQGCVSSWGFAPCRTARPAGGLPLLTLPFLPLEEQLLDLKKNSGSSKSDSPCKGACFSSQCESEAWLQTAAVTAEVCSSTGVKGRGHSRRGHLLPVCLDRLSSPVPWRMKRPWCYIEHFRRFEK